MAETADYYEVLGVSRDADSETIKSAFRHLARRYHPDVSTEADAEQHFREVAEAYGVLSDPTRRASYDAQGSVGLPGTTAEDLWSGIDFDDIFGSGAGDFGSLFGRLFRAASAPPQRGEDVRVDLVIPLEEVSTGGDHAVTIRRPGVCQQCWGRGTSPSTASRRCPYCGGTGQRTVIRRQGPLQVRQTSACPECAGSGRITDQPCAACAATGRAVRTETVTVRIPPGIPEGTKLRLAGHGTPSPVAGGPAGDAYVSIHSRSDPQFTRDGADLWHDLHIAAHEAALGVTTTLSLPGGHATVRVPSGVQPGNVLRVAGKGLPRYGEDGRGNLHLTVIPDIPRKLSPRQRQLYEQLRAEDADLVNMADGSHEALAPEVAVPEIVASSGEASSVDRRQLILASVLLLVGAGLDIVGGIATISSSPVHFAGALTIWGWLMVILCAAQLLSAAMIWPGTRQSHGRRSG